MDNTLRFTLFKAIFPILGIITVNVDAAMTVSYGYKWYYGSSPNVNGCNLTFGPYF